MLLTPPLCLSSPHTHAHPPHPQILRCTKICWERMKICIEPSAGVGIGALLSDEFREKFPAGEYANVGVVLCGGNVDIGKFAEMVK